MAPAAFLIVASFACQAYAFPSYTDSLSKRQADPNPWQPPPLGAVRAPCPALNTLANHGFINRNGRNITAQAMQQAFLDAFSMGFDATLAGGQNSVNLCSTITKKTCTSFDLDMLDTPHAIEHDGSMTRLDREMAFNLNADNTAFNQGIWDTTRAVYGGATHIDMALANTARLTRVTQAKAADAPGWFVENSGGSLAEHAFTLSTMNDPTNKDTGNPQARLDWIDYWYVNEQLPTALGWAKPVTSISLNQFNFLALAIGAAKTTTAPPLSTSLPKTVVTSSVAPPPPPFPPTSSSSAVVAPPQATSASAPAAFPPSVPALSSSTKSFSTLSSLTPTMLSAPPRPITFSSSTPSSSPPSLAALSVPTKSAKDLSSLFNSKSMNNSSSTRAAISFSAPFHASSKPVEESSSRRMPKSVEDLSSTSVARPSTSQNQSSQKSIQMVPYPTSNHTRTSIAGNPQSIPPATVTKKITAIPYRNSTSSLYHTSVILKPSTPTDKPLFPTDEPYYPLKRPFASIATIITTAMPPYNPTSASYAALSSASASFSSKISSAEAVATSLAGPAPLLPNPYTQILSPEQWNMVLSQIMGWVSSVQRLIDSLLGVWSYAFGAMGPVVTTVPGAAPTAAPVATTPSAANAPLAQGGSWWQPQKGSTGNGYQGPANGNQAGWGGASWQAAQGHAQATCACPPGK